jgi:hypothetical protein
VEKEIVTLDAPTFVVTFLDNKGGNTVRLPIQTMYRPAKEGEGFECAIRVFPSEEVIPLRGIHSTEASAKQVLGLMVAGVLLANGFNQPIGEA